MTDELDLIGELSGAEPLRPEAYQRARAVLRAAIAEPGTVRVLGAISVEDMTMETTSTRETTPVLDNGDTPAVRNHRKINGARRLGIGAGVGVAAAAAVIAVVVASASTGGTVPPVAKSPGAGTAGTADTGASPAGGPLLTLAGYIKTNAPSTGDAWLVISTQVQGTKTMQVNYTLYTDSYKIYSGNSVNDVKQAIARHQDQAKSGGYAPVVKAAILAANSSPAEGRTQMLQTAKDPLVGLNPAAQKTVWDKEQAAAQVIIKQKGGKAKPKPYSSQAVQQHFDNALWAYSTEALSAGDGNTLVRQGVLRLLSTISGVSVAHSTTNGKATLTITAGSEVFAGAGSEVLTIDANTGMLVKDVSNTPGTPRAYTTYKSSRVTTARL
jgi:hypothetical protein